MPARKKADKDILVATVYSSKLDVFNRKTGVYAGRFPSSFLDAKVEGGAGFSPKNSSPTYGNSTGGLTDPYSSTSKRRFEDTRRADSTAQNAILMLIKTVLGKAPEAVLDARQQFATDELRKQAVESVLSNKEFEKMIVEIKETDRKVRLHERLHALQDQKYTYGRSCAGVVIKDGMPVELKVFASKNLGQVYVKTKDGQCTFNGVEYQDVLQAQHTFKPEDIIYFTSLDHSITPNTLFYGQSRLEGVAHASEAKRIMIEEDVKETAKSNWAPKYILPVPNVNKPSKLTEIANGLDPSKISVINADVGQPIVFNTNGELKELMDAIHRLDEYIIRGIGIPSMFLNFENITNRATTDAVMAFFKETTIEFERSVLQSQLDAQWYDTLVGLITQQDPQEVEAKVRLEFQDLVFDTIADKAAAIQAIENAGIPLPMEEKLIMLGKENLLDQMEELEQAQNDKMAMQRGEQQDEEGEDMDKPGKKAFFKKKTMFVKDKPKKDDE